MDQNLLMIVLGAAAFLIWTVIRGMGGGARISPEDAKKKLDAGKGAVLVDVRTKAEYERKHIPKSILIPLDSIANQADRKLPDKNAEIIVYCASGSRSGMAARTLAKKGYTNIYNLGSISRWPYGTASGSK